MLPLLHPATTTTPYYFSCNNTVCSLLTPALGFVQLLELEEALMLKLTKSSTTLFIFNIYVDVNTSSHETLVVLSWLSSVCAGVVVIIIIVFSHACQYYTLWQNMKFCHVRLLLIIAEAISNLFFVF